MSVGPAYYNENDPVAAHVLRALIAEGVIALGVVDERSIEEVRPNDLSGFSQLHLFAGGGLWSVAARLAGWPDDRPLWTGSCPCQPFSQAGKGRGRDDSRHLWPHMHRLVRAVRPAVVVGEQVASAAGRDWFDGVAADLGDEGYACRAVDIPAAAVDAPHIRQRLYWVALADAIGERRGELGQPQRTGVESACGAVAVGRDDFGVERGSIPDASCERRREGRPEHGVRGGRNAFADADAPERRNSRDSFWSDAEWIECHDGKARRAQPGLRLLADGLPGRVGIWRIAGNAICVPLAAEVIGALIGASDGRAA